MLPKCSPRLPSASQGPLPTLLSLLSRSSSLLLRDFLFTSLNELACPFSAQLRPLPLAFAPRFILLALDFLRRPALSQTWSIATSTTTSLFSSSGVDRPERTTRSSTFEVSHSPPSLFLQKT